MGKTRRRLGREGWRALFVVYSCYRNRNAKISHHCGFSVMTVVRDMEMVPEDTVYSTSPMSTPLLALLATHSCP